MKIRDTTEILIGVLGMGIFMFLLAKCSYIDPNPDRKSY